MMRASGIEASRTHGGGRHGAPAFLSLLSLEQAPSPSAAITLDHDAGINTAMAARSFDPPSRAVHDDAARFRHRPLDPVQLADLLKQAEAIRSSTPALWIAADDRAASRAQPACCPATGDGEAAQPDTLVAYAMNDRALPEDHGYPFRVIAPDRKAPTG